MEGSTIVVDWRGCFDSRRWVREYPEEVSLVVQRRNKKSVVAIVGRTVVLVVCCTELPSLLAGCRNPQVGFVAAVAVVAVAVVKVAPTESPSAPAWSCCSPFPAYRSINHNQKGKRKDKETEILLSRNHRDLGAETPQLKQKKGRIANRV